MSDFGKGLGEGLAFGAVMGLAARQAELRDAYSNLEIAYEDLHKRYKALEVDRDEYKCSYYADLDIVDRLIGLHCEIRQWSADAEKRFRAEIVKWRNELYRAEMRKLGYNPPGD